MIETPRPAAMHLPSLFLALISGFGVLIGLPGALLIGLLASGSEMGTLAWAAALFGLLNLPALVYSLPRAAGRQPLRWEVTNGWRMASIGLVLWVADLAAASILFIRPNAVTAVLLPPLSLLAVGIPLWWLIELGRRGLRSTAQRTWGVATASLMGTIPLVIVVELTVFLFLGILIIVWLVGSSPDLLVQLERMAQSMASGNVGVENMISVLQPYLERPGVIVAGLIILSVLTPLIEEFFKPLALWFIPGHNLTEAEGFTLGMVAGGVFALLETLGTLPALNGRDGLWLMLMLTRSGTGLLHITCSGLVGWGLASAWRKERYLRLAGLYLLAVIVHGSWNFFAQLMAMGGMMPEGSLASTLGRVAPYFMGFLVTVMLFVLVRTNNHLMSKQIEEQQQALTEFASLAGASPPIPRAQRPEPVIPVIQPPPAAGLIADPQPKSETPDSHPDR